MNSFLPIDTLMLGGVVRADPVTWTGQTGADWRTAGNWRFPPRGTRILLR